MYSVIVGSFPALELKGTKGLPEKSKLEKSAAEISYVISGPFNEHKTN